MSNRELLQFLMARTAQLAALVPGGDEHVRPLLERSWGDQRLKTMLVRLEQALDDQAFQTWQNFKRTEPTRYPTVEGDVVVKRNRGNHH